MPRRTDIGIGMVGYAFMGWAQFFDTSDSGPAGFRRVLVTEPTDPYLDGWWPPGHTFGWEHTFTPQARDLLTALADGSQPRPSFDDGLAVQRVLDAVARSAASGPWRRWPAGRPSG
jgi:predicted dehydrogenase